MQCPSVYRCTVHCCDFLFFTSISAVLFSLFKVLGDACYRYCEMGEEKKRGGGGGGDRRRNALLI